MSETVYSVVLLVRDNQPAGVSGLIISPSVPDFRGWRWEVAGGPFCLVTAPDGSKWAFEPDVGEGYWDRITDKVYGTTEHTLFGAIRPIDNANLSEWLGLAYYAWRLENLRLRVIAADRMYERRANDTVKACLDAGKVAYAAILRGTCPALAAAEELSMDVPSEHALCGVSFVGTSAGNPSSIGDFVWFCHRRAGHPNGCSANLAAADHCCVPRILPSSLPVVLRPPYERAWFWGYFPEPAETLNQLVA